MNRVFLQSSNWNLRVTLGTRGVCPRSWSMNCPHSMCMLVSFTERSFSVASSCMVVDTFLVLGSGFPVTPVTLSLLLVPIGKKQLQKIWGAMHCKPIIVNGKRTICKYIWLWNYHLLHKLLSLPFDSIALLVHIRVMNANPVFWSLILISQPFIIDFNRLSS